MKAAVTWILIADGARARVLEHIGPGSGLREVDGLEFSQEHLRARDIYSDRPVRTYESLGSARSSKDPKTDPVDKREADFVRAIVKVLESRLAESAFGRLIIVAAPQALGDIRKALSGKLAESVVAEIAKDLTRVPNQDMPAHLGDLLVV